jgi:putative membrane protein
MLWVARMRSSIVTMGALVLTWLSGAAMASESPADVAFMSEAAQAELTAMKLGKLAQEKANCVGINALGVRLVRDHTRVNRELTRIADSKGLAVPAELDEQHSALVDSLTAKSGPEFDAAYSQAMSTAHAQSIALYTQASSSEDADVARFARLTLPALREHKRLSDVYVVATALPTNRSAVALVAEKN